MDYAICKALNNPRTRELDRAILVYDIMCQWYQNFPKRLDDSPYLQIPPNLKIFKAIGDFHVRGHVKECFPRFALLHVEGAGVVDGEIVETLWSVLNHTTPSTRGATLAHRREILDDHMNHSNWKKLIGTGEWDNRYSRTCLWLTCLSFKFNTEVETRPVVAR